MCIDVLLMEERKKGKERGREGKGKPCWARGVGRYVDFGHRGEDLASRGGMGLEGLDVRVGEFAAGECAVGFCRLCYYGAAEGDVQGRVGEELKVER